MLFPWKLTRSSPQRQNKESHVLSLSKATRAAVLNPCSCPPPVQRRAGCYRASGCVSPAENPAHLLIRHAFLLGHTHGPAQIHGQDVFALQDKSTDVTFSWIDGQKSFSSLQNNRDRLTKACREVSPTLEERF